MSAFTPGPWSIDDAEEPIEITAESRRDMVAICSIETGYEEPFDSEQRANACLIASAPDLLEACRAMIEWDDREKDFAVDFSARMALCEAAFTKARAAIAKATGEQP